jgi:hypothetical protein
MNGFAKLNRMLKSIKPTTFLYCSSDQKFRTESDVCSVNLVFTSIVVSEEFGLLCLRNGASTLRLDQIRKIDCFKREYLAGAKIVVNAGDAEHTIIAR